jgi:hypothetical protein
LSHTNPLNHLVILSKRRSTAFSFWVIGIGLPAAFLAYLFIFWDVDVEVRSLGG